MQEATESSLISTKPIQLISFDDETDDIVMNREASELLSSIHCPIKVIGVIGKYRTGKSYLMNQMLGVQKDGFTLGHTTDGLTRGIWLWGRYVQNENEKYALLCLDSEGLFDDKNTDKRNDNIFILSLLLTSMFVNNIEKNIGGEEISNLALVTKLTKMLLISSSNNNNNNNDGQVDVKNHMPHFVFLVRDFTLELSGGTEETFLNSKLAPLDPKNKKIRKQNEVKHQILSSFDRVSLKVLPPPALSNLKNIEEEDGSNVVSEVFAKTLDIVIKQLLQMVPIKQIRHGDKCIDLNGSSYVQMISQYVNAMNKADRPSIPDAFQKVVEYEEQKAVEEALKSFSRGMDVLELPLEDDKLHCEIGSNFGKAVSSALGGLDLGSKLNVYSTLVNRVYGHDEGSQRFYLNKNSESLLIQSDSLKSTLLKPLLQTITIDANEKECRQQFQTIVVDEFMHKSKLENKAIIVDNMNLELDRKILEVKNQRQKEKHKLERLNLQNKLEEQAEAYKQQLETQKSDLEKKHEDTLKNWNDIHTDMVTKLEKVLESKEMDLSRLQASETTLHETIRMNTLAHKEEIEKLTAEHNCIFHNKINELEQLHTKKLESLQDTHEKMVTKLNEKMNRKSQRIETMTNEHKNTLNSTIQEYKEQLKTQKSDMEASFDRATNDRREIHETIVSNMKQTHQQQLDEISRLKELEQKLLNQMKEQELVLNTKLEDMHKNNQDTESKHKKELEILTTSHEKTKQSQKQELENSFKLANEVKEAQNGEISRLNLIIKQQNDEKTQLKKVEQKLQYDLKILQTTSAAKLTESQQKYEMDLETKIQEQQSLYDKKMSDVEAAHEQSISELNAIVSSKHDEINALNNQKSELERRLEKLSRERSSDSNDVSRLKMCIQQQSEQIDRLESSEKRLQSQLRAMRNETEAKIEKAKGLLENKNEIILQYKEALEKAKSQLSTYKTASQQKEQSWDSGTTVQCVGMTKAGARCNLYTSNLKTSLCHKHS